MDARSLNSSVTSTAAMDALLRRVLRWTAAAASAVLLAAAAWLFIRRLSGALSQPLSGVVLVAVGFLLAGLASLPRVVAQRQTNLLSLIFPAAALLLLAVALSLPGTPVWALVLFWGVLIGEEAVWWGEARRSFRLPPESADAQPQNRATSEFDEPLPHGEPEQEDSLPADVSQQITRAWEEGDEVLFGRQRCRFESGQRVQNVHLAFCPPLAAAPQLSVHVVEGPEATVKTSQNETFGARLEIRLAKTTRRDTDVVVEFYARAATPEDCAE